MGEDETEKLKNNSDDPQHVENSTPLVENPDKEQGSTIVADAGKNTDDVENKKKNGGARPGAGRPKGSMSEKSKLKMKKKELFERRIGKNLGKLFNAQLSLATGLQYVFKREKIVYKDKKGVAKWKWSHLEVVTDPKEIAAYLDGEYKESAVAYYTITVEKPDAKAIDSLIDRYMGKAPQNLNIKDDRPDPVKQILQGFGLLALDDGEESGDDGENSDTEEAPPQDSP